MILHIINDQKFINGGYDLFEKYYPRQNIFIVQVPRNKNFEPTRVKKRDRIFFKALSTKIDIQFIKKIARSNNVKHVLIHYLDPLKASMGIKLKEELNVKLYWILYGADLYGLLQKEGKYELYDYEIPKPRKKNKLISLIKDIYLFKLKGGTKSFVINKFIKNLDNFCFWNYYDYELLKNNFFCPAQYKDFLYFGVIQPITENELPQKAENQVLVNHSASINGNHITVFEKLHKIDSNNSIKKIVSPLSYGNPFVKNMASEKGSQLFGNVFCPLTEFIPMEDYYKVLDEIPVAVFGNRRQEAAGNIFYLMSIGTKVFLREDNNMLKYLRDHGFMVFSFENNLSSIKDISPLPKHQMEQNRNCYIKLFGEERESKMMLDLIDEPDLKQRKIGLL